MSSSDTEEVWVPASGSRRYLTSMRFWGQTGELRQTLTPWHTTPDSAHGGQRTRGRWSSPPTLFAATVSVCQAVQPMGSGDCYVSSPQLLHPVPRAWACDECFPPEPLPQPGSFHCCFTAESLDSGMVSVNCHPGRICNHLGHGPLEMPAGVTILRWEDAHTVLMHCL